MTLVWDGSDLGILETEQIVEEGMTPLNRDRYWKLNRGVDGEFYCFYKQVKVNHATLSDELKSVFGLSNSKVGTHRIKYRNRTYLLIRPALTEDGIIQEEWKSDYVTNIKDHPLFVRQVQELFTVRELLGITSNYDSSVRLRYAKSSKNPKLIGMDDPFPISFFEPKMAPETHGKMLPKTVLDRWFNCKSYETDLSQVARRIFGVTSPNQVPQILYKLRSKIEQVINRVDRDLIGFVTPILDRVRSRLLYGLDVNVSSPYLLKDSSSKEEVRSNLSCGLDVNVSSPYLLKDSSSKDEVRSNLSCGLDVNVSSPYLLKDSSSKEEVKE